MGIICIVMMPHLNSWLISLSNFMQILNKMGKRAVFESPHIIMTKTLISCLSSSLTRLTQQEGVEPWEYSVFNSQTYKENPEGYHDSMFLNAAKRSIRAAFSPLKSCQRILLFQSFPQIRNQGVKPNLLKAIPSKLFSNWPQACQTQNVENLEQKPSLTSCHTCN